MVGMKWRLWEQKILLLMRIRNHSEDTLCKQIYLEGELNNWPGLGQEVRDICQILDIPDANKEFITKSEIKKRSVQPSLQGNEGGSNEDEETRSYKT